MNAEAPRAERNGSTQRDVPLVVDLDGTLIRSDMLVESAFTLIKANVLYLFMFPYWLLRGKARLKHEIATRVEVEPADLPYHETFLGFLRAEKEAGRYLVLATASHGRIAREITSHLGLFDEVIASEIDVNRAGRRKLERLREAFGESGFDYAGNAAVDLPLWQAARHAVVVNPDAGVERRARAIGDVVRVFDDREGRVKPWLKAIRLHQWLKNLLVFVPLTMAQQLDDPLLVAKVSGAFLAFGLCASSVYLLNDLLDLGDDRQHPTKRRRPFACGSVSIVHGVAAIPLLLATAIGIGAWVGLPFLLVLAIYYACTLCYSLVLKRRVLVDVLTLATLYTVRIIAGAAAVAVMPSFWLLAFSMFLFLSLALVKRYAEFRMVQERGRTAAPGRGYAVDDLETLSQFGTASAYMAVLVLALYIDSPGVEELYTYPSVLWLLCPLLLYLVMRVWLLARRNRLHEDPVVFVIRDRISQLVLAVGMVLLWVAV